MHQVWTFPPDKIIDVICLGRVAVDLYSEQIGSSIEESQTFRKYLGGCAGNIAIGSARLGLRSAMFSCVGTDAMGQFVKQTLRQEGVDISLISETSKHLTALVILGIVPPDHFPLIFYRENCADMQVKSKDADIHTIAKAKALLITGTCLSTPPMRETTHQIIQQAKVVNTRIIFDLDYRPVLWGLTAQGDGETRYKASQAVTQAYQDILSDCDLLVGTEEEIRITAGHDDISNALKIVRSFTSAPIVMKQGIKGCAIYFDDLHRPITSPAFPIKILNVLGAGDAFLSGFMRALLREESFVKAAVYGNACGAIVVTRHGCAPAMPTYDEVMKFIKNYSDTKRIEDVRFSYS